MITKQKLTTALGGAFTTRKAVAAALGYKNPASVAKYLEGLPKVNGTRYWSEDVIERILGDYK